MLGLACLLALSTYPVAAATFVIEFDQDLAGVPDPGSATWPGEIALPKFEDSLGTLTGITLTLSTTFAGDVGFENLQLGAANTIDLDQPLTVAYRLPSSGSPIPRDLGLFASSGVLGSYDGTTDFAGSSGTSTTPVPDTDSMVMTLEAADFASYRSSTGPASFVVAVNADLGTPTVGGNGAKDYTYLAAWMATTQVQVTYTFEADQLVPEGPGILAAAGLTAVAFAHRFRRRHPRA